MSRLPTSLARVEVAAVVLSFAVYSAASGQWAVLFGASVVALVGRFVTGARGGVGLPRSIIALFILLALANALRSTLADGVDVEDFSQFLVLVLLAKMFDGHTPRDVGQVLTLSAFLAIGGVLLSPALSVGALLVVFVPVLAVAVVRYHLWAAAWRAERAWRAALMHAPATASRYEARALRRVVGITLSGTLAVSVIVFVIIPRGIGGEAFGDWATFQSGTVTGFNDRVQLGGEGVISESQAVVLEMAVSDGQGRQLGAPEQFFYLRGAVLTEYERGQWRPIEDGPDWRSNDNLSTRERTGFGAPIGDANMKVTVRLRSVPRRERFYLFSVWEPAAIRLGRVGSLRYQVGTKVLTASINDSALTYEVWTQLEGSSPVAGADWERVVREIAGPEVAQLARDILSSAEIEPDPTLRDPSLDALAARTIERTLRERYGYTLDQQRGPPDVDPVRWFLFESREGHCEYFASAMVAMCRSVGVPARMVTGYIAAEWVAGDGVYRVRESNAHAWVEAQVGPGQWRRFDPSPPANIQQIHSAEPGLLARMARLIDALEYAWVNNIVGFDEARRLGIIGAERSEGNGLARRLAESAERDGILRQLLGGIVSLIGGVILILIAVAVFRSVRRTRRVRQRKSAAWIDDGPEAAERRRQAAFYDEMLRELERIGSPKPAWMPPQRFSTTIGDRPPVQRLVRELSQLFYTLRFGGRALSAAELERAASLLREVRELPAPGPGNGVKSENRA